MRVGVTVVESWSESVFPLSVECPLDWCEFLGFGVTAAPCLVCFSLKSTLIYGHPACSQGIQAIPLCYSSTCRGGRGGGPAKAKASHESPTIRCVTRDVDLALAQLAQPRGHEVSGVGTDTAGQHFNLADSSLLMSSFNFDL